MPDLKTSQRPGTDTTPFLPGAAPQGVVDLQRAYYQKEIPREAALASASLVFGFTPAEAEKLFPVVAPVPPLRTRWAIASVLLGALAGFIGAFLLAQELILDPRGNSPVPVQWRALASFLTVVGGILIGALVGPWLRIGMVSIWRRHTETT
jgi:hypothetical protein